jgi:hypothetical protein
MPSVIRHESRLVVVCIECRDGTIEVLQPVRFDDFPRVLFRAGEWVLSLVSRDPKAPVERGKLPVLGPICRECALRIYGPAIMDAAREQFR